MAFVADKFGIPANPNAETSDELIFDRWPVNLEQPSRIEGGNELDFCIDEARRYLLGFLIREQQFLD
jgi:hypothetical protein